MKQRKKRVIGLICFGFLLLKSGIGATDQAIAVSFDTLFPETNFKKAHDACMQVWAELDELLRAGNVPQDQRNVIIDASTGRLMYADFCCDTMKRDGIESVKSDDLVYLLRVLDLIGIRVNHLAEQQSCDHLSCLKRVVAAMKEKVTMLGDLSRKF